MLPRVTDIDEPFPPLAGSLDYLGINYYTRELSIGHLTGGTPYESAAVPGRAAQRSRLGDLSRGAVPAAAPLCASRLAADRDRDRRLRRAGGVAGAVSCASHVYAVDRARAEGVDVRGFIYWSLTDNFEWSHGYRGHFGLFSIDFHDPILTRRPTSAVAVFQEAARNLGTLH